MVHGTATVRVVVHADAPRPPSRCTEP